MQKEMFEFVNKMTQSVMDSAQKLGELNLKTLDKMVAQQSELASAYFNASTKTLELMGKAKDYQGLMAGQAEVVREYGEALVAAVKKGTTLVNEARTEYGALVELNVKTAQEQMGEVAKATRKAA